MNIGLEKTISKDSFVISDSTAPESIYRIAHIFPKQKGSYADLSQTMASLINFGIYNLPFVGTNLCGYEPETTDEELCARYF